MAKINANTASSVLRIREFLGLNENPDGDTHIQDGELSEMRNFRITRDNHLQIRPGQKTVLDLRALWDSAPERDATLEEPRFCGVWRGVIAGKTHIIAAFGGLLFDVDIDKQTASVCGSCTQDDTAFFGFSNKVYLLNGHEYLSWDGKAGSAFSTVEGYIPTVLTATSPAGAGTLLENVNRLTGKRRVKYSPDGTAKTFCLPETGIDEVCGVDGTSLSYTADLSAGTVTFSEPPPMGVNTLSITYRKGSGSRAEVESMRRAEFYNGTTDTRVFLYGDGTNRTIYSGMDLDSAAPSAEYFPDLYEAAVGDENTPITSMIRHYARLLVFKPNSAWSVDSSAVTATDGTSTAAFFVTPVNRQIGNEPLGQVQLLENNPVTMDGHSVYQWKATSYSGSITSDNRNAQRISDKVRDIFASFDSARIVTFNRRDENEFWFLCDGRAAILNYANTTWYLYNNMPFLAALDVDGEVYGFTRAGGVRHVSRRYRNDDGADIDAYAATGSMDFGRDWMMKYSPMVFVALQPENGARIYVTVETNRRSDYPEKLVAAGFTSFTHVDFAHFSFCTNHKPRVKRVKMKVKKATFYKLIFKSKSASATATVIETDVQLRYAGNVK